MRRKTAAFCSMLSHLNLSLCNQPIPAFAKKVQGGCVITRSQFRSWMSDASPW